MDEPLAALDQASKQEILPYLESLHEELAIPLIYVSHTTDEIARLANHLILMEVGQVVASGTIQQMLTRLDLSLAHDIHAFVVIEAHVAEYDTFFHLTHLEFNGGRITMAGKKLEMGQKVRLQLAARDVSLTLEHQSHTSILNILPATVDEIMPEGKAQVIVKLLVGQVPILSRVTRKSAEELKLDKGKQVFAQVKSVALLS